jgi:hypothetical protein
VAAESTALTTISAVKGVLGVSSSKFDVELGRLIAAATSAIEDYAMHTFAKQTYEEKVEGSNHPLLMVTHVPIIGTPTIICDSSPVIDFEVKDASAGVLYRRLGWLSADWVGWGAEPAIIPGTGIQNYYVTYEAGYVTPGLVDSDLPKHVEQACVETVIFWYRAEKRDRSVKSKKIGDLNISYKDQPGVPSAWSLGLPPSARALLSRRVR